MNISLRRFVAGGLFLALLAVNVFIPLGPIGPVRASAAITQRDELGDWLHYNGIFFGDMTSYTADSEGAVAVGGKTVKWGIGGGYDAGGSYYFNNYVQMGHYTNPNDYPTVLLAAEEIQVGASTPGGHFNVFGGPIVMSPALKAKHDAGTNKLTPYDSKVWFETVSQELIDEWFAYQYLFTTNALQQYLHANEVSITYQQFSTGKYITDLGPEHFVNKTLKYQGQVDKKILSITVHTDAVLNQPTLPISAKWAQNYELVIFNFPDAVNVNMSGDPQSVREGLTYNKTYPDYHLTAAQAAEKQALCEKTIYSFPNAREINMTSVYLLGSLLAPNANVSWNGGSINGQLICNDFTTQGSMELHAHRLCRRAREVVEDPEENGSVELVKYLYYKEGSTVALPDAQFQLHEYDAELKAFSLYSSQVYTTDSDGKLFIGHLPLGRYKLVEIEAPPGFALDAANSTGELDFTLTREHLEASLELICYNEPLHTSIHFVKTEKGSPGTTLSGAQFQLTRLPDKYDFVPGQAITRNTVSGNDGSFYFEGLPMGSYVLKELSPPGNYQRMEDFYLDIVFVESTGELSVVEAGTDIPLTATAASPYPIENEPGIPDNLVRIFKYDSASGEVSIARGLEGAKFHLYRKAGDMWTLVNAEGGGPLVIETNQSGFGEIENLAVGDYRLVEVDFPQGYGVANTLVDNAKEPHRYAAEFSTSMSLLEIAVNVPNTLLTTSLELVKVGEAGQPLSGAKFALYLLDDKGADVEQVLEAATRSDGTLTLSPLSQGRYRLAEVQAPAGYKPLEGDIFIQVDFEQADGTVELTVDTQGLGGLVHYSARESQLTVENQPYTSSLVLYKINRDIFQNGTDWQEDITYTMNYLEDAKFQLQRKAEGFSGAYQDFGHPFTTTFSGYGQDSWGNQMAGGAIQGLPWGDYRIIELEAPPGYINTTQDGVVGSFSITQQMAEEEVQVELTISNTADTPNSKIKIRKVDRNQPNMGLKDVEFKLWVIDDALFPLTGREHLETVMPNLMRYGQKKYATQRPLLTDDDGYLELELEPGLYVLFEYEPPEGYLYTLERGQTLERATDPSFYDYTYLFRVVSMPDPADGVRIQWVDRYKIQNGEVIHFDVDAQDKDNSVWSPSGFNEDEYRSFTITNKRLEEMTATVILEKLGGDKALAGAKFTLFHAPFKDEENPVYTDEDYVNTIGVYTSGEYGQVAIEDLAEGMYRLVETSTPSGYLPASNSLYFSLAVNGYSKMLDFYDGDGNLQAGYDEPVIQGDGSPSKAPVFRTEFDLGRLVNEVEKIPTGEITLLKVDEADGSPLPGAVFTLYKADKEAEGGWSQLNTGLSTVEDGTLTINDLPVGSYKLVETTPPTDYQHNSTEYQFVMVLIGDLVFPDTSTGKWSSQGQLLVENTRELAPTTPEGELTLLKVDAADSTPLSDAVFTLYKEDGEAEHGWTLLRTGLTTGKDGTLNIDNLPAGNYKLVETTPPTGYQQSGEEHLFAMVLRGEEVLPDITSGSWNKEKQFIVTNTKEEKPSALEGSIILLKVDAEDNVPLSGAVFALYREDAENGGNWAELRTGLTTGENGTLNIGGLPTGSYKLVETAPPTGYQQSDREYPFAMLLIGEEVSPNRSIGEWTSSSQLLVKNIKEEKPSTPVGEITLLKVDSEDNSPLPGAEFALYQQDESADVGWSQRASNLTTGKDGLLTIGGLPPGSYKLVETAPPTGYGLSSEEYEFAIVLDGHVATPDTSSGNWINGQLIIANHREETETTTGEITVRKVDGESGAALSGAIFTLYRQESYGWQELTSGLATNKDGQLTLSGLQPGSYRLMETMAPQGYLLDTHAVVFAMVLDGDVIKPDKSTGNWSDDGCLTVANTPQPNPEAPTGEITIEKVDGEDGTPLAGAVFSLYHEGSNTPLRTGLTTGEDGVLVIQGLAEGSYFLRETQPPQGYQQSDEEYPFDMVLISGVVVPQAQDTALSGVSMALYRWYPEEETTNQAETGSPEEDTPSTDDGTSESQAESPVDELGSFPEEPSIPREELSSSAEQGDSQSQAQQGSSASQGNSLEDKDNQGAVAGNESAEEGSSDQKEPSAQEFESQLDGNSTPGSSAEEDSSTKGAKAPEQGSQDPPDESSGDNMDVLRSGLRDNPVLQLSWAGSIVALSSADEGSWVLLEEISLTTDSQGAVTLKDLPKGRYQLRPIKENRADTVEFTIIGSEEVVLQVAVHFLDDAPQSLVVTNTKEPEETPSRPGGGGGSGGGGGGGDKPDSERFPPSEFIPHYDDEEEVEPEMPEEPAPTPAPEPENPETGSPKTVGLIASGMGGIGLGVAYLNRRTLWWWLRKR